MKRRLGIGARALVLFCLLLSGQAAHAGKHPDWVGTDLSGKPCRGKAGGFGPFDYTAPGAKDRLRVVEVTHFTKGVESLTSKVRMTGSFYANIDYTLRASPNHHRALRTLITLFDDHPAMSDGERRKATPPECYLQRAIVFNPRDPVVRALFGFYLHRKGRVEDAVEQYRTALERSPDHPEIHYNLGLALVALKRYDEALDHAEQAYAGGYPLPGLKSQLERAGFRVQALER
jgi:hypothetical protein